MRGDLCGDDATATDSRVADDADLQRSLFHAGILTGQ
jgi:hypothetical protein